MSTSTFVLDMSLRVQSKKKKRSKMNLIATLSVELIRNVASFLTLNNVLCELARLNRYYHIMICREGIDGVDLPRLFTTHLKLGGSRWRICRMVYDLIHKYSLLRLKSLHLDQNLFLDSEIIAEIGDHTIVGNEAETELMDAEFSYELRDYADHNADFPPIAGSAYFELYKSLRLSDNFVFPNLKYIAPELESLEFGANSVTPELVDAIFRIDDQRGHFRPGHFSFSIKSYHWLRGFLDGFPKSLVNLSINLTELEMCNFPNNLCTLFLDRIDFTDCVEFPTELVELTIKNCSFYSDFSIMVFNP